MEFTTIITYVLPHEAAVPKALLESEGIPCFLLNESTVQSYNFYSNAVGGIKLQVRTSDAERANEILRIGGFLGKELILPEEKSILVDGEEQWKTDPEAEHNTIREFHPEGSRRIHPLVLTGSIFLIITIGIFVLMYFRSAPAQEPIPDFESLLTQNKWHIDQLVRTSTFSGSFKGLTFPKMTSQSVDSVRKDKLIFVANGNLIFPRNNSRCGWRIKEDSITIGQSDSASAIHPGTYKLKLINDYNIILLNDTLSVFLQRQL